MSGSLPARLVALAALVGLAAGAAAVYSVTAQKRYEARAELLVSPVPARDTTFLGFSVLRESGDPGRVVATAARLVRTPEVAEAVQLQLGLHESRQKTLRSVSAQPVDGSNLVAVVGKASTAARAAQLANAFAAELVAERTVRFQSEVAQAVARLAQQLARARASAPESLALARRLATLRGLVGARDPTLQVASNAVAPSSAAWPRTRLLVWLAALAALAAGGSFLLGLPLLRRRGRATEPAAAAPRAREPEPPAVPPGPPEPEPEPEPEREPEPVPESALLDVHSGRWRLEELQRLVDDGGAKFPDRLDEWTTYLFFLREHVGSDGRLPSEFDWLVEETFEDLLPEQPRS